jgi:hypothetical protein
MGNGRGWGERGRLRQWVVRPATGVCSLSHSQSSLPPLAHDSPRLIAADESSRSNTSICLQLNLSKEKVKALTTLLEKEGVAYDIGSYRDAPPGLRLWGGATVEAEDMAILMQWIRWAYHAVQ